MTVLTLNISEPKTSVHFNPFIGDVREIQVIDFFASQELSSI